MTSAALPHAPGVHPLPPGGVPALLDAARAAGVALHRIDLGACRDKPALLRAIAATLAFPAWFGHNWDALADCLGDLSWLAEPCVAVVFEHAEALHGAAPEDYRTVLEIFAEAAESLAADGRRLILFAPPAAQS